MARKIPDDIYAAYLKWHETDKQSDEIHAIYHELAIRYLGTKDAIEMGKLMVELTRRRIQSEDGE